MAVPLRSRIQFHHHEIIPEVQGVVIRELSLWGVYTYYEIPRIHRTIFMLLGLPSYITKLIADDSEENHPVIVEVVESVRSV